MSKNTFRTKNSKYNIDLNNKSEEKTNIIQKEETSNAFRNKSSNKIEVKIKNENENLEINKNKEKEKIEKELEKEREENELIYRILQIKKLSKIISQWNEKKESEYELLSIIKEKTLYENDLSNYNLDTKINLKVEKLENQLNQMDEIFESKAAVDYFKVYLLQKSITNFYPENLDFLEEINAFKHLNILKRKKQLTYMKENYIDNSKVILYLTEQQTKNIIYFLEKNEFNRTNLNRIEFDIKIFFIKNYFSQIYQDFLTNGDNFQHSYLEMVVENRRLDLDIKNKDE